MGSKFFFALILGISLVVFVLRGGSSDQDVTQQEVLHDQAPNAPATSAQPVFSQADAAPPSSGEQIVLDRQTDGHFYAFAESGGAEIRLMVDTGASAIALTGEDATAIGLSWNEDELQKVGRGASGDVYGKPVIIDQLQVGDLIVDNVQAAIIPRGLDVSLLGQSFLSKVGTVNIAGDVMTLQ